jgi:bacteriorhodopsin
VSSLSLAFLQGGSPAPYVFQWTTLWAWIGFGFFFLGIVVIAAMGTRATEQSVGHFVTKLFVCLIAMASYFALALDQGSVTAGEGGAEFAYARFIDWSITTPLLLLGLALLALPRAREKLPLVLGLMGTDVFMIVTGLFSGLSNEATNAWWPWYIPSAIAQVVIYALLFGPLVREAKDQAQHGRKMLKSRERQERYQGAVHVGESAWYLTMSLLLAGIWLAYPVNFFLSEQGIGVWGVDASSTIYTVADIIAKPIYSFIFLGGILAIEKRAKKEADRQPEEHMTETEKAPLEAEEAHREAELARAEAERLRAAGPVQVDTGQPVVEEVDGAGLRRTPGQQ